MSSKSVQTPSRRGGWNRLPLAYAIVILSTAAAAGVGHAVIGRSVDRVAASSALLDDAHAQLGAANAILGYAVGFRQSNVGGTSTQVMLGLRDADVHLQSLHASPSGALANVTDDAAALQERVEQADSAYDDVVAASNALLALSAPGSNAQPAQIDAAVDRVATTEATFSDALQSAQTIYERSATTATGDLRSEELALTITIIALLVVEIVVLIAPAHRDAAKTLERSIRSQEQNARIGSEVARHVADRERKEAETQFQTLFRNATIGVALTDERGRILDSNPALRRILGYAESELLGCQFGEWADDATAPADDGECERVYARKDGQKIWVEERLSKAQAPSGASLVSVGMVHDITARKEAEQRLRHDATYDSLTGLSNRKVFQRATERAFRRASGSPAETFAVLMIDLDRFKFVNDSRGHRFGDAVLTEIGRRIKAWARPNDVVARFGGDEFTALLRGASDPAASAGLADALQAALSAPIVLGDLTIRTTASIGICVWSPAVRSADEMLQAADAAAYRAKANGRACSIVYDIDMAAGDRIRNRIGTELRFALERDQLRVVYQPVFESKHRRCVGFEALLRWSHPELGEVSPGMFIPIAEESGLIAAIGNFVLRHAGDQLAVFREHLANCTMNVNVSTQQFVDPKFLTELEATLQETGLPGASLGLEITETTMLDGERLAGDLLDGIRRTGARLVLDDFGTGYSSFGYLQRLPIDALKIDQRFVKGGADGLASPPIVRALLALSESMNIAVVAEGVETEQQARELASMGCRYLQGYLLSKPLEAADALAMMQAHRESERPASV